MKKIFAVLLLAWFLASCGTKKVEENPSEKVWIANPASEYCVAQGGKSEIRKNSDGSEYWVCILADWKEVEEWEYFRKNNWSATSGEITITPDGNWSWTVKITPEKTSTWTSNLSLIHIWRCRRAI